MFLKITQFASLAGVTPRILRHYDKLDLFKPTYIDPINGYRYYQLEQLATWHRLLALRALELPLTQIRTLLQADLPTADARHILVKHQQHLAARMNADLVRLQTTAAHIASLSQVRPGPLVVMKPLSAVRGLHVRALLQHQETIQSVFERATTRLRECGLYARVLAVIGIYPQHTLLQPGQHVCLPFPFEGFYLLSGDRIRTPIQSTDFMLLPSTLRRVTQAACILHSGPYQRLFDSYHVLLDHLHTSGYQVAGLPREVYLRPHGPLEEGLTEIQIPVTA